MKSNFKGALLGLIVGDALGAPFEGYPRGSVNFDGDMVGGGLHNIAAGQWTDDSSMALCLAESLIKDGFDLKSQLAKYAKWHKDGYLSSKEHAFGIGRNTNISITEFINDNTLPPERERAAGNGSIMRLAPIPMYFFNNLDKTEYFSAKSSQATHNNPMAVDACKFLGVLLYHAIAGKDKDYLLNKVYADLDLNPRVLKRVAGDYKEKSASEIDSDGFVLNTLEASLWTFYNTTSFEEAVTEAINLGGDTDTTAAVVGQMAGAYYGSDNIFKKWVNKLAKKELIMSLIRGLYQTKKN